MTTCSNCSHTITAKCSECGREFLCGESSAPCPKANCLERVCADKYGGQKMDAQVGPIETPRVAA